MKRTKKNNIVLGVFIICLSFLQTEIFAQKKLEMDKSEKSRRKEKLIKLNKQSFINRNNERASDSTRKADIDKGKELAKLFRADPESATYKGMSAKRFESTEEGKFGGDVIEFTKSSSFGHINAIVRVVSGFMAGMYEYNQEDSELLALYVIYYNRKHRGNIDYVKENFAENDIVEKEKLGIPEKFVGWSGLTQILVPVEKNLAKGGGIDIATFELEDQVNPDIDAGNKKKFAKLQNKKIKSEKEEFLQKYEAIKKKEKELLDRKKAIDEKLAELMKDPEKNKEEIAKLQKERQKIEKELESVAIEKKNIENKLEQIARREEMRKLGITSEKEYLAYLESQKKKVEPEPEPEPVVIVEEPKPVVTPPPVKKTPLEDVNFWQSFHLKDRIIAGRESIQIARVGIVTIGYQLPYTEMSELQLFLFGSGELYLIKSSEGLKLDQKSPLIYYDGKIFVYESLSGQTYLTQLTPQLDFEYRSSDPIDPDSKIGFLGDNIVITKKQKNGGANDEIMFSKKDLSLVK